MRELAMNCVRFGEGVAAVANYHRELKARRRTGRGAWYALVRFNQNEDGAFTEIDRVQELCKTRKAAVEALKRLVAANTHRLGEQVSIETELLSELEWGTPAEEDDEPASSNG